jgi:two-component system chemotaxis sensor kinase CheA
LESKLLELEQSPHNQQLIEAVFRAMHTLKGIGAMFGFHVVSEYTHHLETIYDKIREKIIAIDHSIIEVTFHSIDHLRNLLADRNLGNKEIALKHEILLSQLEKIVSDRPVIMVEKEGSIPTGGDKDDENVTWYIQFVCSEELTRRAINIEFIFQDLSQLGTYSIFNHSDEYNDTLGNRDEMWGIILNSSSSYTEIEEVFMFVPEHVRIIRLTDDIPEIPAGKKFGGSINDLATVPAEVKKVDDLIIREEAGDKAQVPTAHKTPRISVGADKLDKLMYLVSELFTTRSELLMATRTTDLARIKIAVEKVDKLATQFRKNALSIRLVPLRELSLKFKRLIRDLSKQLSKDIDFEVKGDDTELDKNLVDSLADPLMHLIRNCIDHGIETPEERKALNKSSAGVIRFNAYQSGNYIYIQVSDDGKGIDLKSIQEKAVQKKMILPGYTPGEKELLDLIFLPGFSTAQSLTQVSGRGVGMDVVKRTISDLRGTIDLETEKGKGTTFTLKLQQTISIMDTLLVQTGDSYFTIILEEVEVCGLETHQKLTERQNSHVEVSGELLPYISLREAFSIDCPQPEAERFIVIRRQNSRFAIIADTIIGQYQAVIKPLDSLLKTKDYLSGASIMGDGNIAFMLDTFKLSKSSYKQINS